MTQENKKSKVAGWSGGFYVVHTKIESTIIVVKEKKPSSNPMEASAHIPGVDASVLAELPQILSQPIVTIPTNNPPKVTIKTRRLGPRNDSVVATIPKETHWYDCLPCCGKK